MGYLFDLTQKTAVNAPAEVLWVGRNIRWLGTKDAGWRPPLQKISSMLLNIYRKKKGGGGGGHDSLVPFCRFPILFTQLLSSEIRERLVG